MKNKLFLTVLFLLPLLSTMHAQQYKDMMSNTSINFYDVVQEGERFFNAMDDKFAKGSGYKGFQRWINNNEYKYYPTGRRDNVNPNFALNSLKSFQAKFPEQFSQQKKNGGWRELGPNSIDSITQSLSVGIGRIEMVYADPDNKDKLYLGSISGGFWRSLDEGQTWLGGSTDFLPGAGVNTFTVDPNDTDHILINVRNSRNGSTYGVYESTDGGATITETAFLPAAIGEGGLGSNFMINRVIYHPIIPSMVFVGTTNGMYKSTDNLVTWEKVENGGNYQFIEFHPTDETIVYATNRFNATTRGFLYKSTNTGDSFIPTSLIEGNNGAVGQIKVSANAPSDVYFANSNGFHKSVDEGETFSLVGLPPEKLYAFGVNDTDETNIILGGVDLFKSVNGGVNFEKETSWFLSDDIHGPGSFLEKYINSTKYVHADLRVINSVNGTFYLGTDGTMSKSTDGGSNWTNLMRSGVGVRENYKLGLSQSNNGLAISGSQDNGTSIYKDTGWIEFIGGDGMEALIHPLNEDWMVTSYQFGGRIRSTDGGLTQKSATVSGSEQGFWQSPLLYDPNDHMIIYDFRDAVYKSENFSYTYEKLGESIFNIQQAELAQNNSNILIISQSANISKSVDGGVTFNNIKGTLPDSGIQDIAFDPLDDDTIIVVYASHQDDGQKVYMSTNGGTDWDNITFNIGNIPVHSVVIDHSEASNIYIGTEIGVFTKPMEGTSWTLYGPSLPNTTVEELEINYGANTIKAATWGRGLWEYDLVDRGSFPSINYTKITDLPTFKVPKQGVDQFVTSIIEYEGELSNVYVRWSIDTADFTDLNKTISMSNTSGNTWVSEEPLPNAIEGEKVFFKVFAEGGTQDISETYKFMYTVREGVLGLDDLVADFSSIEIYPNPSQDSFEITGNKSEIKAVKIYDFVGRELLTQSFSNGQIPIDVSRLSPAVYFVVIEIGSEQVVRELIKK